MLKWKIHQDGCYVATGREGQRYEVGEGPKGTWRLLVCGIFTKDFEDLADAFNVALEWEMEE